MVNFFGMEIFGSNKFSINSIWLIDFKIPLVSHGLLLLFISFRLSLVIGTCLSSISIILLEIFWKDLSTLPSETLRILSQFTFSKSVINFLELKCLKILFVDVFLWISRYWIIGCNLKLCMVVRYWGNMIACNTAMVYTTAENVIY